MTTTDISPEAVERLACILEGRGGFVKDSTITATLRALSAALTQSRADTAAAYEKAADVAYFRNWSITGDMIRALATPDQSSALAAIEAAAEARGMWRAADIADDWATDEQRRFGNGGPANAILAAIPQGDTTND